jgi:molybdopterin converting factor small subunit
MPEVRLLAGLRERLAGGADRLRISAQDVGELLESLIAGSGEPENSIRLLYADPSKAATARDLRVLVNGRSVQFLGGLDTPLREEDTVTLHMTGARGYPGG